MAQLCETVHQLVNDLIEMVRRTNIFNKLDIVRVELQDWYRNGQPDGKTSRIFARPLQAGQHEHMIV